MFKKYILKYLIIIGEELNWIKWIWKICKKILMYYILVIIMMIIIIIMIIIMIKDLMGVFRFLCVLFVF